MPIVPGVRARVHARVRLPAGALIPLSLGGCALGVTARLVDEFAPKWIGNMGAIWFLAGFVAGRLVKLPRLGARAGAICLAVATVAYYALRLVVDPITIDDLVPIPLWWLVIGTAIGLASGWLGARSHALVETWGAPAGVFLGEAITVLVLRQRVTQAALEICCAVMCLRLTRSAWKRGAVLAATTIPYVAGFAALYRLALW